MPINLKQIKHRVKSAKNIGEITKAMQMVAASKMKKAQKEALESKPYAEKIFEVVVSLIKKTNRKLHPLLKIPPNDNYPLLILISTNRGLCGSLNLNLFQTISSFVEKKKIKSKAKFDYLLLGKKGLKFMVELGGEFFADFSDINPFREAVGPIIKTATGEFLENKNTSVWLAYNKFVNALKQEPVIQKILPITKAKTKIEDKEKEPEYLIEPSSKEIIDALLPFFLEAQVREAILQAKASEYSARMIAMKNASDNARDLVDGLTLEYDKARQQAVTMEILDIVISKTAMEENEKR